MILRVRSDREGSTISGLHDEYELSQHDHHQRRRYPQCHIDDNKSSPLFKGSDYPTNSRLYIWRSHQNLNIQNQIDQIYQ
ncbi:hypothetical protein A3Q56_03468 [Intoshia linei]|uniref:Uncharacterized protein n=1 Tax=Intoshia linei TaxID=1819745 RepID=A0A177B5S9_9BILA|nr:hypothetical protein A3Q56_03468 [Intoshia linei]